MTVDQVDATVSAVQNPSQVEFPEKDLHPSQQGEAAEEEPRPIEILEVEVILPHEPHKIKVPVALTETLQDIRQSILENPFTYYHSCFYLEHNGVRLNDYRELATIPGLKECAQLKLREDLYTERESRIHILRLRELLKGYQPPCGKYGYDEGLSVFHAIAPSPNPLVKKKKKSERSPESLTATSFEGFNFEETTAALSTYYPADAVTVPPKCLRQLTMSGWNPVTPARRLAGDLLYLTVTTIENKVFEITSSTNGYFVNNSTTETFDPSRKAPIHNMKAHSLIHLLQHLSPAFRTNMAKIQQHLLSTDILQLIQGASTHVNYPWLTTPRTPAYDACRPCEAQLTAGADDSLHDWNEDIQSQRELPRETLQDRILRDRLLNKVYTDFFDACVQAAYSVAEGNLPAVNPNEPAESHMFVHNNLFISKTFDGLNQFDRYGGEAAAYVAASKDVIGVRLLNQLDLEGIYTMGSCLVDYRGERYVVQCVIPGLFRMQELVQYGTTDLGVNILNNKKFHELTAKLAEMLHLAPHEVKDTAGRSFTLNTSLDVKGICGAEGRHYLVDLHRLNPVDIAFQEAECVEREGFKAYPHRMTLLRRELVEIFYASKLKAWREERLRSAQAQADGCQKDASRPAVDEVEFDYRLNPDVFTELCAVRDPVGEERVRECSNYIGSVILPTFIKEIAAHILSAVDSSTLTKVLHARGINMRYLGKIYQLLSEENAGSAATKLVFLSEMVLRSCKFLLRRILREAPGAASSDCVAHFFNCLFASADDAPQPTLQLECAYTALTPASLRDSLLETVATRFRYAITADELKRVPRLSLLRELCIVVGVQLLARDYRLDGPLEAPCLNGASHQQAPPARFRPSDIIALLPRLKHTLPTLSYPEELLETGRQTMAQGQRQLGLDYLSEAVAIFEQVLGHISPDTAQCYSNIATVHYHLSDFKSAEAFQKKAVIGYERCLGLDHPDTLQALIQYGFYLNGAGRVEDSLKVIRFALDKWYPLYGESNLDIAYANHNLGMIFQKWDHHELSLKCIQRACKIYETLLGTRHITTAGCYSSLARAHHFLCDYKSAIASEKVANAIYSEVLGTDNIATLRSSKALHDFTSNAVYLAREAALEKSPEFRELKLRVQATLRREQARRDAEPAPANLGHLSVDDLVEFIDGKAAKPNKPKGRRNKKKAVATK
ncbi:Intracellular distribution of mitochondria [Massospora cicadina]|nr:Intracellular distribution of mitochondria [Massospora cicadina]